MPHVTKAELAAMTLPRSALGPQATGLSVHHPLGFQTNAQAAKARLDPRITATSLSRAGRLSGYVSEYQDSQSRGVSALIRGAGLLQVASDVELYRDTAAAAGQLTRVVSDCRARVGKPIKDGAMLERCASFPLQRIADGAAGLRYEIRVKGLHVYYTQVLLRRGRLLALVVEARADPKDMDARLISFAQGLADRIKDILSAGIRTGPVSTS
jgi:hypothetical protein